MSSRRDLTKTWSVSPDQLGAYDSAIVRCIAGEFSKELLLRITRKAGVDVSRRMERLMSKHVHAKMDDLGKLGAAERQRMANLIVAAELEERDTMPGRLTPLRRFDSQ